MNKGKPPSGPVLIELDDTAPKAETPATAPPVPEFDALPTPTGQAMQTVAKLGARRPSRLVRWFWSLLVGLVGFVVSLAAWDFVFRLLDRNPLLGYTALTLIAALIAVLLGLTLREWLAFVRLRRVDGIQQSAEAALVHGNLDEARSVVTRLDRLYGDREDLRWGHDRLKSRMGDVFDADGLLMLAETELLVPLDQAAMAEVEAAARQVATVTAIVPLALADVATALTANMRMIRRIAEVYGGRAGFFGSWRLTRAVMTHLVATGAVAVGDDLIGTVAGGSVLSKISRRFGEGVVNGALTARVGVAAMEVCRPLPFGKNRRPSVTGLVKRALTGLFGSKPGD